MVDQDKKQWSAEVLDSIQASSLTELLSQHAHVFIKNYGPSSIATTSIRGASASQIGVYWNGVPIQSPMLGLMDISLLPISSGDQVELITGNSSAEHGSGAIGGSLHLNSSDLSTLPQYRFDVETGSFGSNKLQATWVNTLMDNFRVRVHASYDRAKNNYPYYIKDIKKTLDHADHTALHVKHDIQWDINEKSQLSVRYWGASTQRQIPPRTVQNISTAEQEDKSHRFSGAYQYRSGTYKIEAHLGHSREQLIYKDPSVKINAPSAFTSTYGDVILSKKNHAYAWKIKGEHLYTQAMIDAYGPDAPEEHRTSLLMSIIAHKAHIPYEISVRQVLNDSKLLFPIPSLRLYYNWKHHTFSSSIGSVYRQATFNDRYWRPGGNPDILPESGWESSASWNLAQEKWNFRADVFSRWINNWILWTPDSKSGFWTAQNAAQVWSRGLEISQKWNLGKWALASGYAYTRSTFQRPLEKPSIKKGAQLWYTPIHTAHSSVVYNFGRGHLSYRHQYTGSTSGVNKDLDAFHLGSVSIHSKIALGDYTFKTFIAINNIWNHTYRIIEQRPMPLRNFRIGTTIIFN